MEHGFLIHGEEDHVGVAIRDLQAGEVVTGVYLSSRQPVTVRVREAIGLGHKVALAALRPGDPLRKYNEVVGVVTQAIEPGDHVHVHNIKSGRWG